MDDNLYLMVRRQHLAAIHLLCLLVVLITHRKLRNGNRNNALTREDMLHRRQVREEMLHELSYGGKCRELIRMSENAFRILCQKLESDGGLRSTQRMSIEEQVARFLHIVENDFRNRFVSFFYRRSGSTTSRHFHRVLDAIISLEDQYIIQPTGDTVQKEILEKRRFYPFFKDCIGAIDGTHVRVKVPNKDAPRYRGRKGYPTINVLAACTFDLKFTYVLSGWEGTTSDSRVLKDALTREDKLHTPEGKFYLVDGATGVRAETAKERNKRLKENDKRVETIEEIDQLLETNDITLENFTSADDIQVISPTPHPQVKLPSSSTSKKRKFEKDDEFTSTILSSINNVADAIDRSTKDLCKVMESSRPRVYSEEEIYKELELMGMVSEDEIFNAYLFLVEHPEKARALFGCPLHMRMNMLRKMMGARD